MERNTVIQGDCLDIIKEMNDNSVDIVFTSPPYNRKRNDKYTHYDDIIEDYFGWSCKVIDELIRVSKGNVYYNIQKNYYNKMDVFKIIGRYSEQICDIIIWEKSNPLPANGFNITNAYEFIIVFGKNIKANQTYTKNHITTSVTQMIAEHKAIMHKDVAMFIIDRFSSIGDTILDPFAGTGTTGVICQRLNRNYILIEKTPEYVEIIHTMLKENKTNYPLTWLSEGKYN